MIWILSAKAERSQDRFPSPEAIRFYILISPAMYKAAADHGFTLAVLGNAANRQQIETLQSIQPLNFFQVSLEGLPDYNDYIRGKGHFEQDYDLPEATA